MALFPGKNRRFLVELEKKLGDRTEAFKKAVKYCQKHDILKEFMELHATEVLSMLMTEWNWDDALAVRYEEGMEEGIERGLEQGLNQGREEGLEEGLEQGRMIIARNLLAEGSTPEFVQKITGLSLDEIAKL
jgi:predicted transposase/invertase (TIGR01784 family)